MSDYAGEKTLEPTPHRRQQARREGHVAKSRDLGSAVLLAAGLAALAALGGGLVGGLVEFAQRQWGGEPCLTADPQSVVAHWNAIVGMLGRSVLPVLGLICLAAVAVHVLQVGFLFLPQRLAPDFSRLDPLGGLRRIFSASGMVQWCFSMGKLAAVSLVAGAALWGQRESIAGLPGLAPAGIALQAGRILLWTALKIAAALVVLALADYAYQWWRHEQDLKMTPQEMREEMRNLEGDPQLIARRKQAQRDLASQRKKR